jgi:conjugative transfer signal peptidase TraF
MSARALDTRRASCTGNGAAVILGAAILGCVVILVAGFCVGLRVNTTPSEPLGLWRIAPIDRPVAIGDLVFICMPNSAVQREGMSRGYLHRGLCPSGTAPLIKKVAAIAGQQITIDRSVSIDGVPLHNSRLVDRDGLGRSIRPFSGGMVPRGQVFLHSAFPGSWDSRYFGPVPTAGILGSARKVLTYR